MARVVVCMTVSTHEHGTLIRELLVYCSFLQDYKNSHYIITTLANRKSSELEACAVWTRPLTGTAGVYWNESIYEIWRLPTGMVSFA